MPLSSAARADFLLLLVTLIAAAGWIFSKEALQEMPPLLFIGVRFLLAGAILLIPAYKGCLDLLNARALKPVFGLGLLMSSALLCWIMGLYHGHHLGEGAFITSMGVILVPLMAWLTYRERAQRSTWLSLPVAIAGLGLLSLEGGLSLAAGQFWFLCAALLFSVHFVLVSKMALMVPAIVLTAVQLLVVGSGGIIVSAVFESWPESVSDSAIGWVVASAVIATSLRFAIQTYAQSLAPASHVALIMTLEPVWAALLAAIIYAEVMTGLQLAGCGLIFMAMLVSRWRWLQPLYYACRSRFPSR
ncbi:DMT family transporter [Amphritea sp. 1_MG-2023]|uniref:DMT family transporter n=1 Tax=Amphritea sp. 1_MG-2023 TaxID=3062670 RepID=UPI0026E2350F|nr:DMT family transporter [Amphritea sp. 1_MG-2023]MDO6563455.1 DMT family transporter [Amphritea sp. 1_MG-2023]